MSIPRNGVRIHVTRIFEGYRQEDCCERSAHEDFAVGEVDHLENSVDQRISHGYQGIDAAQAPGP